MVIFLQGFQAIIDTKMDFPSTSRKKIKIRPGHVVLYSFMIHWNEIFINLSMHSRTTWLCQQWRWHPTPTSSRSTQSKESVTFITNTLWRPIKNIRRSNWVNYNIFIIVIKKARRELKHTLKQVACILECRVKKALANMEAEAQCLPWYYPPVAPDVRLCTPFEARDLKAVIGAMSVNECRVWYSMTTTWKYRVREKLLLMIQ